MEELIGACGLYCGACDNYRAFKEENAYLQLTDKFNTREKINANECKGCHSQKLSEHCNACTIRLCAREKGLFHCGLCSEYPCSILTQFKNEGDTWPGAKHRTLIFTNLRKLSVEGKSAWLHEMHHRWACACGLSFTYYERTCQRCGTALNSCLERTTPENS